MQRFKYNYTYFILPYSFKMKHQEYIKSLMLDYKVKVHKFERFKDFEIYSYFKETILKNVFYNMDSKSLRKIEDYEIYKKNMFKKNKNDLNKDFYLNAYLKYSDLNNENENNLDEIVSYLSQKYVTFFEISLNLELGDITSELKDSKENNVSTNIHEIIRKNTNGINFEIESAQLIVFRTGISFIAIKTVLPETNSINDVLDFNYKFKWLLSGSESAKNSKNININIKGQSITELKQKILNITKLDDKKEKSFTWTDSFYTFSYLCVDNYFWDENTNSEELKKLSTNYMKNYNSENDILMDLEGLESDGITKVINHSKYTKIGVSKVSSNLICSGIDPFNFTVLPRIYETKYLYTYLLSLYNKIFLSKYNDKISQLKEYESSEAKNILKKFNEFTQKIKATEITLSESGSVYYNDLKEVLNVENNYSEVMDKYQVALNYDRSKKNEIKIKKKNFLFIISLIVNSILLIVLYILIMYFN